MKNRLLSTFTLIFLINCATKPIVTEIKKNESDKVQPIAVSDEVKLLDTKLVSGKELFENNCGKCHQLYESTDFPKTEWKSILNQMQKKAHLSDKETEMVYNYLTVNLK